MTYRNGTRFAEAAYFRALIRHGRRLGADVFLFSPRDVNTARQEVNGFVPDVRKGWKEKRFRWPDVVIDRYRWYPLAKHDDYLPFRRRELFRYASSRFANKWRVYHVLAADETARRWLPEARIYSRRNVAYMLKAYGNVYIKPTHGSGGRSIVKLERRKNGYAFLGRTRLQGKRVLILPTLPALLRRLDRWVEREKQGNEAFFVQQGLHLELLPGRHVDMRLLIQKDGEGIWRVTGMGARIGDVKSSTTNLHGGGSAVSAAGFLLERFGEEKAEMIVRECMRLARRIVDVLEHHYGPMMEFGIDIGVDVAGNVWLIEVNPKPGREIFRKIGQMERYRLAMQRPLEYALYLARTEEHGTDHPAVQGEVDDGEDAAERMAAELEKLMQDPTA
nr:YheC/YheD family protein [Brevibacillus sp. SYP-B805]